MGCLMKISAMLVSLVFVFAFFCSCTAAQKTLEFQSSYEAEFVLDLNDKRYTGTCSRTDENTMIFYIQTPEAFSGGEVVFSGDAMSVAYGGVTLSVDASQDFLPADFPFAVAQTLISLRGSTATVTHQEACIVYEYSTQYGRAVVYQSKEDGSIQRVLCEDARLDIRLQRK